MSSTFAVATNGGVYIIDTSNKIKTTKMLKGEYVYSVNLVYNGNILCGTYMGDYYLLDILSK